MVSDDQPDAREGQVGRLGVAERFAVPLKPGNAGGGPLSHLYGKNGAMVEPVRHRQTKGAATDMLEPKATSHLVSTQSGVRPWNDRSPRAPFLVVDLRDSPEFVRRGRAKAEELEIGWNLLEQHVRADLDFAATRPCRCEKWRHFLFHHDFADEG